MQSKVSQFIEKQRLLVGNSKVIVGLSGGADSVALLHLLCTLGYECIAAHCNFHLRAEESNRDERFVRELCLEKNIDLEVIDFDTQKIATERRISIEMAARDLRYAWFEQIRIARCADAIAVAHHRDDNVETLLLNLIRGTGIRGLSGMAPQNQKVIRPLLCVNRIEIENYIEANSLSFVTDRTNAETLYLRNKIRLELLPWLEEINPSVREAIERTSDNLRSAEHIYLAEIEKQRLQISQQKEGKTFISIDNLKAYAEPSTLLFELLQPFGFNRLVCEEIMQSLDGISGKTFYSPEYILVKDRTDLIIKMKEDHEAVQFLIEENESSVEVPIALTIAQFSTQNFIPPKDKKMACFDARKVKFPLTLRHWQQGDWFVPFGMKGKKKVSDYFSDQKFDRLRKEETWLLCSGNDILWIVGERSDNRFRIDTDTDTILCLKIAD